MIVQVYNLKHSLCYTVNDNVDLRYLLIDIAKHMSEPINVLYARSNLYEYIICKFDKLYNRKHKERNQMYDYSIHVEYDRIRLVDAHTKHVSYVMFNKTNGNCVDKLSRHILYNEVETLRYLLEDIDNRQSGRATETNYHTSSIFEQDFSVLTKMKETAQTIIDKINRFQENITLTDYT